jgi:hypothetical protein
MYFVVRQTHDNNKIKIVGHAHSDTKIALQSLERCCKKYVSGQQGKQFGQDISVINIATLQDITQPLVDKMLIYRVNDDVSNLYVYCRATNVIPGLIYGRTVCVTFNKMATFSVLPYNDLSLSNISSQIPTNTFTQISPPSIPAPPSMTPPKLHIPPTKTQSAPNFSDIMDELRRSPHFQHNCKI